MAENKVVAKVNGKEISQDDVLKFLNEIGPQVAMQFQSPEGIQRVVEELVNQELLYLDAIENKLDKSQEFEDMLEQTKNTLLKSYALNKLIADEEVSEEETKNYYDEHAESYKKKESLIASHILVDSEEKAEDIIKEIDGGLSFEEAAGKYSSCPSKDVGGALGEFTRGQMVPEFEEAAFKMEEKEISKPVKTQFGYHIIKLIEKRPEGQMPFEEVKSQIFEQVLRLKQQDKYLNKIEELKGKYPVELVK